MHSHLQLRRLTLPVCGMPALSLPGYAQPPPMHSAAMKLDRMTKELAGPMKTYVKGFPHPDRLHPFERALLDLTLGAPSHHLLPPPRVPAGQRGTVA